MSIVSSVGDQHEYSLQIQKVDVSDDGQYTCSIQSERNPRPKLLNLIVKGGYRYCSPCRSVQALVYLCVRFFICVSELVLNNECNDFPVSISLY